VKNRLITFLYILSLLLMFFSTTIYAGVNIYSTPRNLPNSKIIHQSGADFRLSDFKGDFVLAHFWSRDCAPCIKELKSLNNFHNQVKDEGIRLILISDNSEWTDSTEQWRFLKKYGASDLEFYVEENGKLSEDFGIFTTPHTVVINTDGQEIGRFRGSETWDKKEVINYIRQLKNSNK